MSVDTSLKTEQFKGAIRINAFVKDGNKWFNNGNVGGYSRNINGWVDDSYGKNQPGLVGANVLRNCTGFASGAFNETYYRGMKLQGLPAKKFPFQFRSKANLFIKGIYDSSYNYGDSSTSSLKDYVIPPESKPPLGGIIVWGGTANHVAYISDVSEDGNTITILQAGWQTTIWTVRNSEDTGWCCDKRTLTRETDKPYLWRYGWTGSDIGRVCLGYIANPGVTTLNDYGVIIGDKSYVPYIFLAKERRWAEVAPYIFNDQKWKPTGIAGGIKSNITATLVNTIRSINNDYFYGTHFMNYGELPTDYSESCRPNNSQRISNAKFIYKYFTFQKWTSNAIAALLGSIEAVSLMNPGYWESANLFGLCSWAKSTFETWSKENSIPDNDKIDIFIQCDRIMCEVMSDTEYINPRNTKYKKNITNNLTYAYNEDLYDRYKNSLSSSTTKSKLQDDLSTFKKFSSSNLEIAVMSDALMVNYIKPDDNSVIEAARVLTEDWLNMIEEWKND